MRKQNKLDVARGLIGTGKRNAVSVVRLSDELGLTEREVRAVIEELRKQGTVICSCNSGYFYPANPAECAEWLPGYLGRAFSVFRCAKGARAYLKK